MEELQRWARQFEQAARTAPREAQQVVKKGAVNIKTDARANATRSAGAHARQYSSTITFDFTAAAAGGTAEVGPEKRGQGNLGNLLEYGSVNNPGHRDLGRAADAEEPRFAEAVDDLGMRLLP